MRVLIIGGTGTLGQELIRQYQGKADLICLSRDELKQRDLKKEFPSVQCVLGDIRDGIPSTIQNVDILYHVAALKHIDLLEDNPEEAVLTNIEGTINAARYAMDTGVKMFAFSSTDKAVHPLNVYGCTKAISERILNRYNEIQRDTVFKVFRWGNVLGSRGSVLDTFVKSLFDENKVRITAPEMTRFLIRIADAVAFMIRVTEGNIAQPLNTVFVPEMKSTDILSLASSVAFALGKNLYDIETIGLRKGEKLHEEILIGKTSENSERFTRQELYALVKEALA